MDKHIVVPCLLRKIVLENLHSANQGVTGMRFRANQCIYWPGLDTSICNHSETCQEFNRKCPKSVSRATSVNTITAIPIRKNLC